MYALILLGCAADLLPGEAVLGADVPATFTYGSPGARLGASVAWDGASWLAAAPGEGRTWRDGEPSDGSSSWVGWWEGRAIAVNGEGEVRVDGEVRWTVPDAVAWAAGPDGILAAGGGVLRFVDAEREVPAPGLRAVAWGTGRVLGVVCGDGCAAHAYDLDGVDLGEVAPAGEGGAVGEWDGVAWAGDPEDAAADGAGRVCAEDGRCVEGLAGDHLGGAIGGGYAVGTFNKWVVPARVRVVPLAGGTVYALERGAETQPVVLAGDGATLVVGAPYHPAHGEPSGAVVVAASGEGT